MDIDPPEHHDGWQEAGPTFEHPSSEEAANGTVNGHARATPDELGAKAAISFLERFHPGTPWALATFGPRGDEVGPAQTFDPSTEQDDAYRFILSLQAKHNIYFTVNCVGVRISKKASKTDIVEIHYLHVDADLPKDIDWSDPPVVAGAKQHVLERLRAYNPPPTAILWSGGGFQAFWRLSEIIVVNGDKELMAPIERRMRAIEKAFGADSCHNADRIMRLPGTMNVLGPTKVRAGRTPERAELIEFHEDRIYDLEDFPELETEHTGARGNGAGYRGGRAPDNLESARDALRVIPADDYSLYLRIGMALMSAFGDEGFGLYREWAMQSIKFDENDIRRKWRSINPQGGINIATLFYLAKERGWRGLGANSGSGDREQSGSAERGKQGSATDPDLSIVRRNRVAAPAFPVEVFGPAADWVRDTAASKSAPVDFVALGVLVATAGVIGAKRRVSPWEGWDEPSILWGVLAGDPSTLKSPAIDPVRDAVMAIERDINRDWTDRQAEYERDKKIADEQRAVWEEEVKKAVNAKKAAKKASDGERVVVTEPPPLPPEASPPKAPTKRQLWISDITSEKAARVLAVNPTVISFRDEISGLLGGFGKYGSSGSERPFWIETYGGRPYRYDRVKLGESIDIAFCAVSLLGGVQPDRLNSLLLTGDDDGLAARPLYTWPDPVPPKRPTRVPDGSTLQAVLRRLYDLSWGKGEDGADRPIIMPLESDAADEFQAWHEQKQWEARLAAAGRLAGAIGKLDGVTLRLAMVLEFLHWAWGRSNEPAPIQISLESVRRAFTIIDGWARTNLERVFAEAALPQPQRDARTIAKWILKHRPERINARELRRTPGFMGPKEPKEMDAALEELVDARWISEERTGQSHRPRKDFIVNPKVYGTTAAA
jgi:hypothetical protein